VLRAALTSLAFSITASAIAAQNALSEYTENVVSHVVLHELGHALIREFDLPILANEEVMADTFATFYVVQNMPDQSLALITARVRSFQAEMDEETVFAEHPDDVRRAGQMICLAYGLDPEKFEELARNSGMTGAEAASCRDTASEIGRSWRRLLAPLKRPEGTRVTEFQGIVGEGPWKEAIMSSELTSTLHPVIASFDWHSLITLQFDNCDMGAVWYRNGRRILICDNLIARFEAQNRSR